jgi:hypothetical protein
MGTYTNIFRYYRPNPDELVDVEAHLNFNYRRADIPVASILKYQRSNVNSLVTSFPELVNSGYKFYKIRSNSIWHFRPGETTGPFQDANAFNDVWSTSGISFRSGFRERASSISNTRVSYRLEAGGTQTVEFRGIVERVGQEAWTLNSRTIVLDIPASITPQVVKHAFCTGGNAGGGFFMARADVGTDGTLRLTPFGNTGSANNRFIDLASIRYNRLEAD